MENKARTSTLIQSPANPVSEDTASTPPPDFMAIISRRSTPVWIFLVAIAAVIGGLLLLGVRV